MRACKVIVTSYMPREERLEAKFPCHRQRAMTFNDVQSLLNVVVKLEEIIDPGCEVDTIVVNNNSGYVPGNKFLNEINGKKTHSGHIAVMHRENYGHSYGGYNYAFERLGPAYDYWLFIEDDILLVKDGYMQACIDVLQDPAIGFVALIELACQQFKKNMHAHGGCGCTRRDVLKKVQDTHGCLPHSHKRDASNRDHTIQGEIKFTSVIDELDYKLIPLSSFFAFYYDWIEEHPKFLETDPSQLPKDLYQLPKNLREI